MATMQSQYSTTGLYNAPVSKGLLGCMFLTTCALNVPLLVHLKKFFVWSYWDVFDKYEVWRLVTSKTTFLDTKDLICGSLLIYYFRVFERRYGSHKYASTLLATTIVTSVLELIVSHSLHHFNIDDSLLYQCGSYGFIFPMFVNYFFDVPRVTQTTILGVPFTGKTLTYLIGLQMMSCSKVSAISGLCGVAAGFIYRYNFLKIQSLIYVPKFVARASNILFGWFLKSSAPQDTVVPMGATLEIQQQQQLEILEQQMLLNHAREMRNQARDMRNQANINQNQQYYIPAELAAAGGQLLGNMNNNDYIYQAVQSVLRHRTTPIGDGEIQDAGPSVKEEQVQQLVEMGFERQNVLDALRISNYDINIATNMLLQDS